MSNSTNDKQEGGVPRMPNHPEMPKAPKVDKAALEQSIKSHEGAKSTGETVKK